MKQTERAMQIWQVLICAANNRQIITYEMLAKLIGMGAGTLAQSLGYVMNYCEENEFPPITSLVVRKDTGKPGIGLTTIEELNMDREREYSSMSGLSYTLYKLRILKTYKRQIFL